MFEPHFSYTVEAYGAGVGPDKGLEYLLQQTFISLAFASSFNSFFLQNKYSSSRIYAVIFVKLSYLEF